MAPVTLRDVAAAAGVSISTVSKVVRGQAKGAQLSDATVARVRLTVEKLGYVPNQIARSLRAQRSQQIGLVMDGFLSDGPTTLTLNGALLAGLATTARECHVPAMVLYPQGAAMTDPGSYLDGRIDGLLVRCPLDEDALLVTMLARTWLPLVALWRQEVPDGVGYADVDHRGSARLAVEHLLELGHRRIAYVGPGQPYDNRHFMLRLEGYQQALAAAGITPRPEWHVPDGGAMLALIQSAQPVTAAFAATDLRAAATAATLAQAGVRIPVDLSLVGFDNLVSAELIAGGLTTVEQPIEQMAVHGVRNLLALMGGAPAEECRTLVPGRLVVRRSTARLS